MANVNAKMKQAAIKALIVDTLRDRVVALRRETDQHWTDIAKEVIDEREIARNNEMVRSLMENREALKFQTDLDDWGNDVALEWLNDKDLRVREIVKIGDEDDGTDPLNLRYDLRGGTVGDVIVDIWKEAAPLVGIELPEPILVLTTERPPKDTPHMCSLVDPDEYDDTVLKYDIHQHVPQDCRTQREFKKRAKAIGSDAQALFNSLTEATRNARTDTAVIKAVPALEKYLAEEVPVLTATGEVMNVNDLLTKAAHG